MSVIMHFTGFDTCAKFFKNTVCYLWPIYSFWTGVLYSCY